MSDSKAKTASETVAKPGAEAARKLATKSAGGPAGKTPPKSARRKPGVPRGTKRGAFNKDGSPRKKPGPKPKTVAGSTAKAAPRQAEAPASKPAVKTAATTATPKPAAARSTTSKAPTPKPAAAKPPRTVAELNAQLERVHAKLARADSRRKKAITALEAAQSKLESRESSARAAQRTSLVRRIDAVKAQLATSAADLRESTRADLKAALASQSVDLTGAILSRVEARIEASHAEHSRAVARLSSHLADMARAVDARIGAVETTLARETEARRESFDALTGRLDAVEQDTARAVTDIGERMVALATTLREDIEAVRPPEAADVTARVDALATETQARLDEVGTRFRDEAASAARAAQDAREHAAENTRRHDAAVESLTLRLQNLEAALSARPDALAAPVATPVAVAASAPIHEVEPHLAPVAAFTARAVAEEPVLAGIQWPADAPIVIPELEHVLEEELARNASAPFVAQPDPDRPDHFPVEWTPDAVAQQPSTPQPIPQPAPQPSPVPVAQSFSSAPEPAFAPMPMIDPSVVPMVGEGDVPYGDPGYAEGPTAHRPVAGDSKPKSLLARLRPGMTRAADPDSASDGPSLLRRVGVPTALAGGLAVGMVYLLSGSLGDDDRARQIAAAQGVGDAQPVQPAMAEPGLPPAVLGAGALDATGTPTALAITEVPPITDTSELDVPLLPAGSDAARSLESAAESGNPVAQYQLGLMEVERGNMESGIALVRKASDAGLQAAQYRLAKFYESGQGVAQDLPTAVRLTERAARGGHRIAMHDLGFFHANGIATGQPDPAGAVEWFEKASRHGVLDSQFNLAWLLDEGEALALPRDAEGAYFWYSVAAAGGDSQAEERARRLAGELGSERVAALESRIGGFRIQPVDEAANGIFRDLPWMPPAGVASADEVKTIQTLLNRLGYDTGTPDGQAGPRTQTAIIAYQRARDMEETGEPSAAVLLALQSEAGV